MTPASDPDHFTLRVPPALTFYPPDAPDGAEAPDGALSYWAMANGALEWRSRVCPLPIAAEAADLYQLYDWWQAKVLPLSGGLLDQPNKYLRTMTVFAERFRLQRPPPREE